MSLWVDITDNIEAILNADVTVTGLVNTIRQGMPVKNIPPADYPVVTIWPCQLDNSEFRATKIQDRFIEWVCPLYIASYHNRSDLEDGTAYAVQDSIEQAVLSAVLRDNIFNNGSTQAYQSIDLINSELDKDTQVPYLANVYFLSIRKINEFN